MSNRTSKSKGGPSTSHSKKYDEEDEEDEDDEDEGVMNNNNQRNNRVRQLEAQCAQLTSENNRLKSELKKAKTKSSRLTKVGMITHNDWTGQEAELSERISSFCGSYLFRRYKFLNEGWETYDKEDADSLSSFLKKKITSINISDDLYEEQWDRIYVPTICSKFKSLRCNLNNAIREQYKGELRVSEC